ncbi:MAG: hypothetical protein NTX50_04225 [Candidatus Sumerlaeota bacterium]|nr:hypothetical protein [Candidatus Sumerlaeota bacterium]
MAHFFYLQWRWAQPPAPGQGGFYRPALYSVFAAAIEPYDISGAKIVGWLDALASPASWDPVIWAAFGWILVCLLCGRLTLRLWETYLPRVAHLCVAGVIGLSLTGLVTELLAMAHLFRRGPIVIASAALILILLIAARRRQHRPYIEDGRPVENPVSKRANERQAAREEYADTILPLPGVASKLVYAAAFALIALITALTFYHGAGYAETYWDSLILYLGYARMTFLQQAFPFKAVAQVGIGLGANYPHLFPTFAATGPALAGVWSPLCGQIASPLAGLAACALCYHWVLRLTRHRMIAILVTLLFRAVPLGMIYFIYASDYSFAILFTLAFLYLASLYIETALPGCLVAMTLVCAGASHINYLLLSLWGVWGVAIILAHARRRLTREDIAVLRQEAEQSGVASLYYSVRALEQGEIRQDGPPAQSEIIARCGLRDLLRTKFFWSLAVVGVLMASTWYARNEVLTGNPVYAFFPRLFGGIHINETVMESATHEWRVNGVGLARIADNVLGIPFEELTLWHKIRYAPWFFYAYFQSWQWQPFLFAWVIPGVLLAMAAGLRHALPRRRQETEDRRQEAGEGRRQEVHCVHPVHLVHSQQAEGGKEPGTRNSELGTEVSEPGTRNSELGTRNPELETRNPELGPRPPELPEREGRRLNLRISDLDRIALLSLILMGGLFVYHLALADFYVYQISPALAAWPVFCVFVLEAVRRAPWKQLLVACVFAAAICPGLSSALMGMKIFDVELRALRSPGMTQGEVIRLRYGPDADMIKEVNARCKGARILTHENRHLLYDPSITLVHLDDWETQKLWGEPPDRLLQGLKDLGIRHYLRVPNEANHRVNSLLGIQRLIDSGQLKRLGQWGGNELYEF